MPSSHSNLSSSSTESRPSGSSTYNYYSEYMESHDSQAEQSTQSQRTPRPSFPPHSNEQQRDDYHHTVRPQEMGPWDDFLHTDRNGEGLRETAANNNIGQFEDRWERATYGNNDNSNNQTSHEPDAHDYYDGRERAWRRDNDFIYHDQYGSSRGAVNGSAADASGGSSSNSHRSSHRHAESSRRDHRSSKSSGSKKSKHDNTKDSRRRHH